SFMGWEVVFLFLFLLIYYYLNSVCISYLSPEFVNPTWMAGLPDSCLLSEVTMAIYSGSLAECQSWSLASQLQAGVCFLVVRVRHVRGNLTIHHGVSYLWAHFVITPLVRLKEEFSDTFDIYGAVVSYIHLYADWDLLWNSWFMITVGQNRGKLIVLQDFGGPDLGMGLDIADDWKVRRHVHEHLEAAPVCNKAHIFLTYGSGAQRITAHLYDYLTAQIGQSRCFGIITMDFPAAPLLQMIINFNLERGPSSTKPATRQSNENGWD
uniref:Phosphatidylinositol-specific phospholipase C X domain-containing protein n=1 Tax=Oncorhynchus mykiss TaxID=8022 RepID=A0A8C7RHW8_ONCMY